LKQATIKIIHNIEIAIVIMIVGLFLLANPMSLKYVANKVTKEFDLGYKSIHGNLVTKLYIEDISYKGKIIASSADIDFNILQLLVGHIQVDSISFKKVDIDNLKNFISSFDFESDKNSVTSLPTISLKNVSLDIVPYKKDKLSIEKLTVFIKNIDYDDSFKIDNLKVDLKSNMFNMTYIGSYSNESLLVKKMDIKDLDIKKILYLREMVKSDSNSTDSIIKSIELEKLKITTTPYKEGSYHIKNLNLDIDNLKTDFNTVNAEKLKLDIETNIWKLSSKGDVNGSVYNTDVNVVANDKYFKRFISDIDYKSLNPLKVELKIDKDRLLGVVKAKSKSLLTSKYKDLDLQLLDYITHAKLNFKPLKLHFDVNATLSSKYANKIRLDGNFYYDKKTTYDGILTIDKFKNIDSNLSKMLDKTKIFFNGDIKKVDIAYNGILDLNGSYNIKNKIHQFSVKLPLKTPLKSIDKNLHLENIFPQSITLTKNNSLLKIKNSSKNFDLTGSYNFNSEVLDSNITFAESITKISGKFDSLKVDSYITSLKIFQEKVDEIYKFTPIDLDGDARVSGVINSGKFDFKVDSTWLLYEYTKDKFAFFENALLDFSLEKNLLTIKSYQSSSYIWDRYRKIFSKTPSSLEFLTNGVKVDLNVNDAISVSGLLSDNTQLNIKANRYNLNQIEANLNISIFLKYLSSNTKSSLKGKVTLNSGILKYKPRNSYIVSDDDIIFIHAKKRKDLLKQLKKDFNLNISIVSKKAIQYRYNKNNIKFKPEITLVKDKKEDIKVYGFVKVIDGEYYSDNKLFSLGSGELLFSGNHLNPYLNLKAYYRLNPYDISIFIGGTLESPILNFSSASNLSQNDILAILLFNTKASTLTDENANSSNTALSLFGNSFAKAIMDSLGIKLDRIELLTTQEGTLGVEIEKRLSKRTTIIYQNDLVHSVKIRYQNSKNIETDFTFSPQSSGVDIIFTNER